MKIEFPFEIGQVIWTHSLIDDEWVTVPVTVESYSVDEYGVEITVLHAGGRRETCTISDGGISVNEEQVRNEYLFATRYELIDFLNQEC